MAKSYKIKLKKPEIRDYEDIFRKIRESKEAEFVVNSGFHRYYHFVNCGTTVSIYNPGTGPINVVKRGFCEIWGTDKQRENTRRRLEKIIGGCELI